MSVRSWRSTTKQLWLSLKYKTVWRASFYGLLAWTLKQGSGWRSAVAQPLLTAPIHSPNLCHTWFPGCCLGGGGGLLSRRAVNHWSLTLNQDRHGHTYSWHSTLGWRAGIDPFLFSYLLYVCVAARVRHSICLWELALSLHMWVLQIWLWSAGLVARTFASWDMSPQASDFMNKIPQKQFL